jgi:hypothetical protein
MATNWDDPCETYRVLRKAYMELISGQAKTDVTYMANGVQRRAVFAKGDMRQLQQEMASAQDACSALDGTKSPSRRFAIQAGSRRTIIPGRGW